MYVLITQSQINYLAELGWQAIVDALRQFDGTRRATGFSKEGVLIHAKWLSELVEESMEGRYVAPFIKRSIFPAECAVAANLVNFPSPTLSALLEQELARQKSIREKNKELSRQRARFSSRRWAFIVGPPRRMNNLH